MAINSRELIAIAPVIPVVVLSDAGAAVPLADALQRGGIGVVEVTLRTSAGLEAIRRIASEVPGIVVGAGTVTTPRAAEDAAGAGAQFLVTPGARRHCSTAALATGLPLLPGAATVSEVLALVERGHHCPEVLSRRGQWGLGYPGLGGFGATGCCLLSDGRHCGRERERITWPCPMSRVSAGRG